MGREKRDCWGTVLRCSRIDKETMAVSDGCECCEWSEGSRVGWVGRLKRLEPFRASLTDLAKCGLEPYATQPSSPVSQCQLSARAKKSWSCYNTRVRVRVAEKNPRVTRGEPYQCPTHWVAEHQQISQAMIG